jgi:predicted enzyme related to lactoylglutathione lyase
LIELLVNIDVEDIEKAVAFYCAAFDLSVGRRFDGSVELLGATAPIYLLAETEGSTASSAMTQRRDYRRHWTPVHLDFVVSDVSAAVKRAVAAGARCEGEVRSHQWGKIATLSDPFGNGLCLIEFVGRGYDEIAR